MVLSPVTSFFFARFDGLLGPGVINGFSYPEEEHAKRSLNTLIAPRQRNSHEVIRWNFSLHLVNQM